MGPFNIDLANGTVFEIKADLIQDNAVRTDLDDALLKLLEKDLIEDGVFNIANIEDGRNSALRAVIQRRGQSSFRSTILEIYDYRCAITDCDVEQALDAAHIIPYKGTTTNHVQNGILLRADVHVLFDLYLIGINPASREIVVSKRIRDSKYVSLFSGRKIREPIFVSQRPSIEALTFHFSEMTKREDSI